MEEKITANNGVPIYYYKNDKIHSFCICLYIKAGVLYETEETNGVSHYWEHIIFRNINYLMNDSVYRQLDRLGLSFEGCTYKEFIQIRITGASKNFNEAARIFTMIFEQISLPSSEIATEKKRIKAEIREESERTTIDYFSKKIIWKDTCLGNTILGKIKNLNRIGKTALQNTHNDFFTLGNFFIYVTGCFDNTNLEVLKNYTEKYSFKTDDMLKNNMAPVPEDFSNRNCKVAIKDSRNCYACFSFDVRADKYTYAELVILYDILFGGNNSKVYMELSEKTGYIYSYDAYIESYSNIGTIYFIYEVESGKLIESVKKASEIFKNLKSGITDELDYVTAYYTDNAELILDNAKDLNWNMEYECHILDEKYVTVQQRKHDFEKVTPERINEIIRDIFVSDNLVVALKANKKKFSENEIRNILLTIDDDCDKIKENVVGV